MLQLEYYVYTYTDPRDLEVFYVGFGKNRRITDHIRLALSKKHSNHHFSCRITDIINDGLSPILTKVREHLNMEEAKELEVDLIAKYGRRDLKTGTLTNWTRGGDGHCEWNEEHKKAQSKRRLGIINVVDHAGNKFTVKNTDPRWLSGELKGQNTGIKCSTGHLKNYVQAKDTNGACYRIRKTDQRWISGELIGVNTGTHHTPESKRKLSLSLKGKDTTGRPGKRCTIDNTTVFKSLTELITKLGRGKNGYRHPNFRYLD